MVLKAWLMIEWWDFSEIYAKLCYRNIVNLIMTNSNRQPIKIEECDQKQWVDSINSQKIDDYEYFTAFIHGIKTDKVHGHLFAWFGKRYSSKLNVKRIPVTLVKVHNLDL